MSDLYELMDQGLDALRGAKSNADVFRVLGDSSGSSNRKGFWMGDGAELMGVLSSAGWSIVRADSDYYWVMKAPNGDLLSNVEGDLYPDNSLLPNEGARRTAITWYPTTDTAGHPKPGGWGTVVDDDSIIHNGYTWEEAQAAFPGVVRMDRDLPLTIDVVGSKTAEAPSAEGGSTCSECGASIERDPAGESNRTWHHNDGDKHDHEAKPSGGDKESAKMAASVTDRAHYDCPRCDRLGAEASKKADASGHEETVSQEGCYATSQPSKESRRTAAGPNYTPGAVDARHEDYYHRQGDPEARHEYNGSHERCHTCGFTRNHIIHSEKKESARKVASVLSDVGSMKSGDKLIFGAEGCYAQVWYDGFDAIGDDNYPTGNQGGEWEVVIKDTPDLVGGRQLAAIRRFRFVEPKMQGWQASATADYIISKLYDLRRRGMRKGAPFADYKDFADCVAKNADKRDPDAYCGKIKHQVEDGKTAAMDPNDMWVYVQADGTESGWFTSVEKAEMDSVRTPGADYSWRKLTPDEVASFTGWAGELAYQQASKKHAEHKTEGPYKVQVAGSGENVWSENALRFDTVEEAKAYASDLLGRWFGADMARVVSSDTPTRAAVDTADPQIVINYRTGARRAIAAQTRPARFVSTVARELGQMASLMRGGREAAKYRGDLDRSVAFTILLDVWPEYGSSPVDNGETITAFLNDWYEDPGTDMYAFGKKWVEGLAADVRGKGKLGARHQAGDDYKLECYGCGKKGTNEDFGLGNKRKCPSCGSYEVHSPDAQANWKRKSSARKQAGNPHAVGSPAWFRWEYGEGDPASYGPTNGVPRDIFPEGGVPLHGDLTPEQEAWMKQRKRSTRHQASPEGWWPLTPSARWPGEDALTCPVCSSQNVSITGNNLGSDIVRNNLYTLLICNDCGNRQFFPMKMDRGGNFSYASRHTARSLSEIASEIAKDWRPPNFAAAPYLDAMRSLDTLSDNYGADDARSIVLYFLTNAGSWRGETAKRVKAELKAMLAGKSSGRLAVTDHPNNDESGAVVTDHDQGAVVRDPRNPRGLYGGDRNILLQDRALDLHDEEKRNQLEMRQLESTGARSDYAHWNEDQDYMWYQEEGRFGSEEHEYDDNPYEGPDDEAPEEGEESVCTECGEDIVATADGEWADDNGSTMCGNTYGHTPGGSSYVSGYGDITPQQERAQMGITGSRRPFGREGGTIMQPDPDGGISSRDAGPYIQEGWERLVDDGMEPEEATERLHSLPDDTAGLHEGGFLHDLLNFGNPDKWGEVKWEPGESIEDAPTIEQWRKEHGKDAAHTAMGQDDYDMLVAHFMGQHVTVRGGFDEGITGTVTGHRWRAPNPYGGGPGSYPVFEITTDGGDVIGGISGDALEVS